MKKQRSNISHDEMCLISSFHILIVGKQSRKKIIITPIIIFCASTVGLFGSKRFSLQIYGGNPLSKKSDNG